MRTSQKLADKLDDSLCVMCVVLWSLRCFKYLRFIVFDCCHVTGKKGPMDRKKGGEKNLSPLSKQFVSAPLVCDFWCGVPVNKLMTDIISCRLPM